MVVLAAAVCTKSGTALLSRQFIEMTRSRIEGLLASFPKLISAGQQHTFVETESVRYVYQPLEELYLVLITNRASNILQDIDTLHLLARVIPEYCEKMNEKEIRKFAFEIIFAFDEIIHLGYRENVNLSQLKTVIEMDSHEEKIQEALAKMKEREAKENAKLKIKQMEIQRREAMKKAVPGMPGNFNPSSMGSSYSSPSVDSRMDKPSGLYSNSQAESNFSTNSSSAVAANEHSVSASAGFGKGMKLGKKEKSSNFMDALKTEVGIEEVSVPKTASPTSPIHESIGSSDRKASVLSPIVNQEAVHVVIDERINLQTHRDGGLEAMEVKGELSIKSRDNDKLNLKLKVLSTADKAYQFKTHPNIDKRLFQTDSVIALKDQSRSFPLDQSTGVLKWRFVAQDESSIPLSINCWPSGTGNGNFDVNIEYELLNKELCLKNTVIRINIPSLKAPVIKDLVGDYEYNRPNRVLEWKVPSIDENNPEGSLEFSVAEVASENGFFPVQAYFTSEKTLAQVDVLDVLSTADGSPIVFSKEIIMMPDEYAVV